MQIAIDENNIRITASNAIKGKNYKCPVCRGDVILRQGSINICHFAHKSNECVDSWHYDMSDWHLSMQERFPEEQREVVISHNGQIHRADTLKDDMVIEFQHSPISIDELRERNLFYNAAGYKVAWVFDCSEQYNIGAIADYSRDTYVCPKTNEFGIKRFGEQGCLYCKYCAAVKEYAHGFASYCFYPNAIRESGGSHTGYECSEAPRF